MFKKIISFLLIYSIFFVNTASAMNAGYPPYGTENSSRHITPQLKEELNKKLKIAKKKERPSFLKRFFCCCWGKKSNKDSIIIRVDEDAEEETGCCYKKDESSPEDETASKDPQNIQVKGSEDMDSDEIFSEYTVYPKIYSKSYPQTHKDQEYNENSPLMKENIQNSNPLPKEVSLENFSSIGPLKGFGEDPEAGNQLDFNSLVTFVQNLDLENPTDKKVLAFLEYTQNYVVEGKFTPAQIVFGGVLGTAIGIGVGNAMSPIYFEGLDEIKLNYFIVNNDLSLPVVIYLVSTFGIDATARNIRTLGELTGPSKEGFSIPQKKIKIGPIELEPRHILLSAAALGSITTMIFPIYCLWNVERLDAEEDPEDQAMYSTFFRVLAPFLGVDAFLTTFRFFKKKIDEKFNEIAIHQAFASTKLNLENTKINYAWALRTAALKRFDDLILLFRRTSDKDIPQIYRQIFSKEKHSKISAKLLKSAQNLQVLKALYRIHAAFDIPEEPKQDWKRRVSSFLGWGLPTLATLGRELIVNLAVHRLLGGLGLDFINKDMESVLAVIFGGGVVNFFQGRVEVDTCKAGFYDLLFGETDEEDTSHNWLWKTLKRGGKGCIYIQGVRDLLPEILAGVAAMHGWSVACQLAILIPHGIVGTINNAMMYQESYGDVINGIDSLISYKYLTPGYMRNKSIRTTNGYKELYKILDPDTLIKVEDQLLLSK